jgi:HlyD family secretion protein
MAGDLFRKSALEKLSSPEQLDVMMQVTSPKGWLALIGISLLLAFGAVWSVVGRIPIRVDGDGLLIRGAAVLDVTSQASGRIAQLFVKPGDVVKRGQVVAKIDQKELETKLATSRQELELKISNTKAQLADLQAQSGRAGASGGSILAQLRAQRAELLAKQQRLQKLVKEGIITGDSVFQVKEQIAATEQQIAQNELSVSGPQNQVKELQRQITELEARLKNAETEGTGQLSSSTEVTTPFDGRVLEVTAGAGSMVPPGGSLMTLEQVDAPLETVLYVPASEGKRVRPGMDVRISPSTVKAEEYGFMLGKVKSVSEFPVSPDGLRRVVRNERLVDQMMRGGPPIEVIATPLLDKSTPSGFKWSSSKGPPSPVFSGTLAKGSVVVEKKKPIAYVLPIVKKSLGA